MGEVFDFSSFPVLETERLRLRQLTHDDVRRFCRLREHPGLFGADGRHAREFSSATKS